MKHIIKMNGYGYVDVKPDIMELYFELRSKDKNYSKALIRLRSHHVGLIRSFEKNGFDGSKLSMGPMTVDVNAQTENTDQHFVLRQSLSFEDHINMDALSQLLEDFVLADDFYFNVSYKDSQWKHHNDEALIYALKDAKRKADMVAKEMGLELYQVLEVNETGQVFPSFMRSQADLAVKDLKIEKNVEVHYEVKKN